MLPSKDLDRAAAMTAYQKIFDTMAKNEHDLFQDHSHCIKCGQACPVSGQLTQKKLRILIAGTECKAWSSNGKQQRQGHPSMLVFLVFIFDLRHRKYDVGIHEITELHPEQLLPHFLQGQYQCHTFRISPYHLGFPARRPRKYTVMIKQDHIFDGGQEHFMKLFGQCPSIDPHVLWVAPSSEIDNRFMQVAIGRGNIPRPDQPQDWTPLLTPFQRSRLEQTYRRPDNSIPKFIDLSKSTERCSPGDFMCTLLTNSTLWSNDLRRPNTPKEGLVFQGVPAYDGLSTKFSVEWPKCIGDTISDTEAIFLAGNAMHIGVVGTLFLYVLASLSPVLQEERGDKNMTMGTISSGRTSGSASHACRFRSMGSILELDSV